MASGQIMKEFRICFIGSTELIEVFTEERSLGLLF